MLHTQKCFPLALNFVLSPLSPVDVGIAVVVVVVPVPPGWHLKAHVGIYRSAPNIPHPLRVVVIYIDTSGPGVT